MIFGDRSDGSVVRRNIISNSNVRHNIESTGSTASSNLVYENCLWLPSLDDHGGEPPNSGVAASHAGFTLGPNAIADPRFVDRVVFRPAPRSPCRGFGPRD